MDVLNYLEDKLNPVLGGGDVLIIAPPFDAVDCPLLGPHLLQACAGQQGYKVDLLYLSLLISSLAGSDFSRKLAYAQSNWMLGERLFARSAHGLPPLGLDPEDGCSGGKREDPNPDCYGTTPFDPDLFMDMEQLCYEFIEEVAPVIAAGRYPIIGCSVKWEQTNAGIALLNRIKALSPDTVTIMGGPRCKGEMARGVASLSDSLDYVFQGEAEFSFLTFLDDHAAGRLPARRIIPEIPLADLDGIKVPGFDAYFHQLEHFRAPGNLSAKTTEISPMDWDKMKIPRFDIYFHQVAGASLPGSPSADQINIWYESSRGCWKSLKKRCAFCAVNHDGFRRKSSEKVLSDFLHLGEKYPGLTITIADDNIPASFFRKLLPKLAQIPNSPDFSSFANTATTLKELWVMKKAGCRLVVAGIESLSTQVLDLMNKKSTARQNLIFMRNARALGLKTIWFFLFGFPGEKALYYEEMLEFLPFIHHLYPPVTATHVKIYGESDYHRYPERFGIKNLKPFDVYEQVFPETADREKLAFLYHGEHDCAVKHSPETIDRLIHELKVWNKNPKKAILYMKPFMDQYMIYDNRDFLDASRTHFLNHEDATLVMTDQAYTRALKTSPIIQWALDEKLGIILDNWYVSLILAPPDLLMAFEDPHPGNHFAEKLK